MLNTQVLGRKGIPMTRTCVRLTAVIAANLSLVAVAGCTRAEAPEAVAPQNSALKNSPIVPNQSQMAASDEKICYWNDKKYSDGAQVCESGQRHKCWSGKWVDLGNC